MLFPAFYARIFWDECLSAAQAFGIPARSGFEEFFAVTSEPPASIVGNEYYLRIDS